MIARSQQNLHLRQPAIRGLEHVNRYWDRHRECFTAKILPGELYVSRNGELVATTLGSCIAACIWDPYAGIGGMNHFLLPLNGPQDALTWDPEDLASPATRYGAYAMESLINVILREGGKRDRLKIKVFGAANVLRQNITVGQRNIEFVRHYIHQEGLPLIAEDLGDKFPRKVLFDSATGKAWVKRLQSLHNDTLLDRESSYKQQIAQPQISDVELF